MQNTMAAASTLNLQPSIELSGLVPEGYRQVARHLVSVNGAHAELLRYERIDQRNSGPRGEHFSMIVDAGGRLKGYARMDADLARYPLPSCERAQEIARAFLHAHASDLLPRMEISWVAPHHETLVVRDAGMPEMTLAGMKVKCRNGADGTWFWVIVRGDTVMTFERDIVWITFPGHRKTEKWLHDSWLGTQLERQGRKQGRSLPV